MKRKGNIFLIIGLLILAFTSCEEDPAMYELKNPAMLLDNNTSKLTFKGEIVNLHAERVAITADKRLELNFKQGDLRVSLYTFSELEGTYYLTPHSEGLAHTSTAVVTYQGDYYEPTEGTIKLYPKKDNIISGQYDIKASHPEKGMIHLKTGLFKCFPTDKPQNAGSSPPLTPSHPFPPDKGVVSNDTVTLRFSAFAPGGHKLTYSIWFGEAYNNQPLLATGLSEAKYKVDGLKKNTQYYWRVAAIDQMGNTVRSRLWTFTVR